MRDNALDLKCFIVKLRHLRQSRSLSWISPAFGHRQRSRKIDDETCYVSSLSKVWHRKDKTLSWNGAFGVIFFTCLAYCLHGTSYRNKQMSRRSCVGFFVEYFSSYLRDGYLTRFTPVRITFPPHYEFLFVDSTGWRKSAIVCWFPALTLHARVFCASLPSRIHAINIPYNHHEVIAASI